MKHRTEMGTEHAHGSTAKREPTGQRMKISATGIADAIAGTGATDDEPTQPTRGRTPLLV